jgi:CIC family chloride channel protein
VKLKNTGLFILLPSVGITIIFYLRKYVFKKRRNKGITEIYKTIDHRKDHLPLFKIPSHYLNGFLTVVFGGSTGIEVSTVVATATAGNHAYERHFSANNYKLELIFAGVTAGIAILFNSPIGGALFALEVIARKWNKSLLIACITSALVSFALISVIKPHRILHIHTQEWQWTAVPFFICLSLFSGVLSAYFTKLVIVIKEYFSGINNNFLRVNLGALFLGFLLFVFPYLYGDSYHGLISILQSPQDFSIPLLILLALLKPIASAVTLGAGGDGGVFAPSIVAGAFLGIAIALFCNTYLGTSFVYINFALVGAAATLSASIYAPLTTLFLICNFALGGFGLFFPIIGACYISTYCAKRILPYNVYTFQPK